MTFEGVKTALVVDDKAATCQSTRQMLQDLGVKRTEHAPSAPEALRRLEHGTFDILICERFLQPINVIDLRRFMDVRAHWRTIPIIVVSHRDDAGDRARLAAAGLPICIARPFTIGVLADTLQLAMTAGRPPHPGAPQRATA